MKDFLFKIVAGIISEGAFCEIAEDKADDLEIYTITVPETEIGKVIGKGGKVITALRTLARVKAIREQKRVLVKIADQKGKGFSLPKTTEPTSETEDSSSAV